MITYTFSERTKKTRSIALAIKTAHEIFKGPICLDAVQHRNLDTLLTLPEFNELVDKIVNESQYYG